MNEKTVCNRENNSQSDLWDRKCWIADSVASLVQSRIEYLAEKYAQELKADTNPDSPFWKFTKELDYYCEELRAQNGLRHLAVLNQDASFPSERPSAQSSATCHRTG